ncbi:Heterochromatin protein 1 [Trichuris trichiura]|uniref:Heterochromatin protein 1 n=1 Tax=Trichuris trichiura TaxID=36087 RepID=A0A077Z4S1_TRITR|nr:Heterochromatin protein 1 [Trichuris trichiura]
MRRYREMLMADIKPPPWYVPPSRKNAAKNAAGDKTTTEQSTVATTEDQQQQQQQQQQNARKSPLPECEYVVERIVDKRLVDGKTQYLLKWQGYPDDENSWEPEENLDCKDLIMDFEANFAAKASEPVVSAASPPVLRPEGPISTDSDSAHLGNLTGFERGLTAESIEDGFAWKDIKSYVDYPKAKLNNALAVLIMSNDLKLSMLQLYGTLRFVSILRGVTKINGEVNYFIKFYGCEFEEMIPSSVVRQYCPKLLLEYFEKTSKWAQLIANEEQGEK